MLSTKNKIIKRVRPGKNKYGGSNKEQTFRGFWGYHREMCLEKSFHSGQNFTYGYINSDNDDFYRFGGVGALEFKCNHDLCSSWNNLTALNHESNFDASELNRSRHGWYLRNEIFRENK